MFAAAYAFPVNHPPGEPGMVRFLGPISADSLPGIDREVRGRLRPDETAMVYPNNHRAYELSYRGERS